MSINVAAASLRICSLVCAVGLLAACESDPTPIVEDKQGLNLAPSARSGSGLSAVPGDYRLGPNDRTRITVFGQPNLTGEFMLDGSGSVAFPLIGNVNANGMTPRELQQAIAGKLDPDYLRNPSVSVEVLTRRPFYVLGEVQKPGNYPYITDITALNAVAMAGGYTYRARENSVFITRANDSARAKQRANHDSLVLPGDVIEVPERFF